MRKLSAGFLVALGLIGLPTLAATEPQADLPPDFLPTFQIMDAAYARQDIEGIVARYAPHCAFTEVSLITSMSTPNAAGKDVETKLKTHFRHDLAWQRQNLQQFFTVTDGPPDSQFPPARKTTVTSSVQQSVLNRKATELRLTVERKVHFDRGQAQEIRSEVDEEVWSKNAQGWKLKRLTIHPKGDMIFIG